MPERVGQEDRGDLPRRNPPQPIRKLRCVVSDPAEVAAWEREWGQAWRERQERERRDDSPGG